MNPVTLTDEYFDSVKKYEALYGERTLVLMQVGSFFEYYGIDNETEKIGNIREVAELMNIQLTRRKKEILENHRKNPMMAGFPLANLKKYLHLMIQHGYTVVLIEQVSQPPNPERKVTRVYSPATYVEEIVQVDSTHFVSIYLEEEPGGGGGGGGGAIGYTCGLACMDLSTGLAHIYHNHHPSKKALFEDIYRFVENMSPKEILFTSQGLQGLDEESVRELISSEGRLVHMNWNRLDTKYQTVSYLNAVLEKLYPKHGLLSGIEYIGCERYRETATAFVMGVQWAYDHDPQIIQKMQLPQFYEYHRHLILYHNSAYQLGLLSHERQKTLFDIIQKTSTPMGRRRLKYEMLNPITDVVELERRYERIAQLLPLWERVEQQLSLLGDMERLHRKAELGTLHPHECGALYYMYTNGRQLCDRVLGAELLEAHFGHGREEMEILEAWIAFVERHVHVEELGKYNLQDISNSFFRRGVYTEIDDLQDQIEAIDRYMEEQCKYLSDEIKKKDRGTGGGEEGARVKIEQNDRDGYYMTTTKRRSDLLVPTIAERYQITKGVGTNVRITNGAFQEKSDLLITLRSRVERMVKEKYILFLEELCQEFREGMERWLQVIMAIDVTKSHCKCAVKYGYHRPTLSNQESGTSYLDAKALRHPIIEIIDDKRAYVTNDVYLGERCRGFLLYGVNGVGKSSLSKAIGLNIVMAQMGMYVPSRSFIYHPFTKIFTRINGEDNIFKGMSSFVVEMNELRSILKYSDSRSVVLGDEVCKGTEETSALSIVASAIERFSQQNVNFVLATHFHKLAGLTKIQGLSNIAFKHLSITVDPIRDKIIYGRRLMDGMGMTDYGLSIARFLLEDDIFMRSAKEVRDEITGSHGEILAPTPSNYHREIYMDACAICGRTENLDTHHIVEQHHFDENKRLEHLHRDHAHNLVVLCKTHHEEVHHGNLVIHGYVSTSEGRELQWERRSEEASSPKEDDISTTSTSASASTSASVSISRKKYPLEMVQRVLALSREIQGEYTKVKVIQARMSLDHDVTIPTQTIKKMIAGIY